MSKKSRKTTRVVATGVPSKVEGVVQASAPTVQASAPTRDERPVLSPRPRTDHRTPAAVPAVPAPVADKGVARGPSAKVVAALPQAPAPRAAAPASTAPAFSTPAPIAPAPRAAAPTSAAPTSAAPTHEAISRLAQDLWVQRGRPLGQDIAIWCEAERRLTRKS